MTPEESAAHEAEQFASRDLKAKATYLPDVHRLLPQNPDAEMGVLSSIVLSPLECLGICAEKRITREHFHIPAYGETFVAMREICEKGPLDFITLTNYLRDREKLDGVGGAGFISSLWTFLATATNLSYYLDIVVEKYLAREVIRVAVEHASKAYDYHDSAATMIDGFERDVLAIRSGHDTASVVPIRQTAMEALGSIEAMYENRGKVTGLTTGFVGIDQMLNGLQPEMIIIAGRPSNGKTALAMNIAEHIAITLAKPVAFFSAEMSRLQLVQRWIASRARVNLQAIRNGYMAERDFPAIINATKAISDSGFHLDDGDGMTIEGIRARARRFKREHNIAAIFVDYLQLLKSSERNKRDSREQEVAAVSNGCKGMAKELGVPVVVLAQIGREYEKRGPLSSRPRLSDLRESGSIEQDADTVAFLVRPEMYAETDEERDQLRGRAELIVAKQRNGSLGDVPLTFLAEFTRFQDRAETSDQIEAADEEARRADAARQRTMPL